MIIAEVLTLARLKKLYYIDATTPTAVWVSTTHAKIICPASKRWFLLGGMSYRSVSATVTVLWMNSSDQPLSMLMYSAAATGAGAYPNTAASQLAPLAQVVLEAGDYIDFVFGAAQGATAYVTGVFLEIEMT